MEYQRLIPELSDLGFTVDEYLGYIWSYEHAIAYCTLFWPEFICYNDCIFFKDFSKETYEDFYKPFEVDKTALEKLINHMHLRYMNINIEPAENTVEQYLYLGQILKSMWQAKLKVDFPQREMKVQFLSGSKDDLDGFQITFWTQR